LSDIISTDGSFSEPHKQALELLAGMMIPASGNLPSAADPEIFPATLTALAAHEPLVTAALNALTELATKQHQQAFISLGDAQRIAVVEEFKRLQAAFIGTLQSVVVSGYYQDDRVLLELGMPARSPHPGGFDVAETDWSLLDPVRARQPFYRQVQPNENDHG
jgi:hypothetical protein